MVNIHWGQQIGASCKHGVYFLGTLFFFSSTYVCSIICRVVFLAFNGLLCNKYRIIKWTFLDFSHFLVFWAVLKLSMYSFQSPQMMTPVFSYISMSSEQKITITSWGKSRCIYLIQCLILTVGVSVALWLSNDISNSVAIFIIENILRQKSKTCPIHGYHSLPVHKIRNIKSALFEFRAEWNGLCLTAGRIK